PRLFYESGSHQAGDFPGSDVVFAMNDDLETDDGSLKVLNHGDHVVYDFSGSTYENGNSQNYPLEFQVILYQDGRIRWNFIADGVDTYDEDLYSGLYANEEATDTPVGPGTAVGNASAFNTKSYEYDPATGKISSVPYAVDQDTFFAFGSGPISGTSSEYGVPGNAGLKSGQRYYWSFRYQDSDGYWSAWSTPTSFVADNPPAAADGSVNTDQDQPVSGLLAASDADGDVLTFSVQNQPVHGSVILTDPMTGAFTYTPDSGYSGNDSFGFTASDGSLASNTATETITVTASSTGGGNSGNTGSGGGGDFGGFELILLALLVASIRFARSRRDA
ncbi:MAG TPA: Ig-like domain-containing protein, partial [Pseudomonadales bacterium]|nr:Ig-like domain-containing protein [Pseudomonadales bacterium]